MGAVLRDGGVTFRVWAPHAEQVAVVGSFTDWAERIGLARDEVGKDEHQGTWSVHLPGVPAGEEYQFVLQLGGEETWRVDPWARQMTNSVGNAVIHDTDAFDWSGDDFQMPDWDDVVIYELHIGTFAATHEARGTFERAAGRLGYLRSLGISAVQIMPPFEYAGDISWGYNPSHMFAVESTYGGPNAFKAFVKAAHANGIAVIVDVVHNHLGPSDLDVWRFDGWHEGDGGGIYFYNDWRAETPWGATRPDYGRPEVRAFLASSAITWLTEFRCDGLRFDATNYIRTVHGGLGDEGSQLPDGTTYLQSLNSRIRHGQPWKLLIAEDLQSDPMVTRPVEDGGLGFHAQWDAGFVHTVRAALTELDDAHRDVHAVAAGYAGDMGAGERVVYTESHDEVANGKTRVPEAIAPGAADSWAAKKRSILGAVLVMTAPGIPMIFQGQEMLADRYFDDAVPVDWSGLERHQGIVRLHAHLIALRRNSEHVSRGLRGPNVRVLRADEERRVMVAHRWAAGGVHDDVVVAVNLSAQSLDDYQVGLPAPGQWAVRLNTDATVYDEGFGGHEAHDVTADGPEMDGCEQSGSLSLGAYSAVILSRES